MSGVRYRVRPRTGAVDEAHVPEQKHPLPWDEDVVEEHDAVHLLEPRAERMIEVRATEVEALATQEPEPRGAAGNGEVQGERAVTTRHVAHARGVHGDLVGERPEGGED